MGRLRTIVKEGGFFLPVIPSIRLAIGVDLWFRASG
jgi:hypothetical protein